MGRLNVFGVFKRFEQRRGYVRYVIIIDKYVNYPPNSLFYVFLSNRITDSVCELSRC